MLGQEKSNHKGRIPTIRSNAIIAFLKSTAAPIWIGQLNLITHGLEPLILDEDDWLSCTRVKSWVRMGCALAMNEEGLDMDLRNKTISILYVNYRSKDW